MSKRKMQAMLLVFVLCVANLLYYLVQGNTIDNYVNVKKLKVNLEKNIKNSIEIYEMGYFIKAILSEVDVDEYVKESMDELYNIWKVSNGEITFIDGVISKDTSLGTVYELNYVMGDNKNNLTKSNFIKENPNLEEDLRYCVKKNIDTIIDIKEDYIDDSNIHYKFKLTVEKSNKTTLNGSDKVSELEKKAKDNMYLYKYYNEYNDLTSVNRIISEISINDPVYKIIETVSNIENKHYILEKYSSNQKIKLKNILEKIFEKENILIGIDKKEYNLAYNDYNSQVNFTEKLIIVFILALIGIILFSILIIKKEYINTGYSDEKKFFEKIFLEVNIILLFLTFCQLFGVIISTLKAAHIGGFIITANVYENIILIILYIIDIIISTIIIENILLAFVRLIKKEEFLKSSLIYSSLCRIIKSTSLRIKSIILIIVLPLLCVNRYLIPFVVIGLLYFIGKFVENLEKLRYGILNMKKGNLNDKIYIKDNGILNEMAENVNLISSGLSDVIEKEIKATRTKTELISNVSHDIKTPLTSIITYIDLLKQENLENDKAVEYIDILEEKANRLKILTQNLFEAAKASSGDLPVNLTKIHIKSLVSQVVSEYDEKFMANNLVIKVDIDDNLYINADGELMWRVLSNLLSNIVKYSVVDSRVYIDVFEESEKIKIILKNISEYELNISTDELMERFKRGDESRNTEGSGLGLSIAKDLINLQEGEFDIEIDGDLFKVILEMNKYID